MSSALSARAAIALDFKSPSRAPPQYSTTHAGDDCPYAVFNGEMSPDDWIEFDVAHAGGKYALSLEYAAASSRPLRVRVGATMLPGTVAAQTTPSWEAFQTVDGELEIDFGSGAGTTTVAFQAEDYLPHMKRGTLQPVGAPRPSTTPSPPEVAVFDEAERLLEGEAEAYRASVDQSWALRASEQEAAAVSSIEAVDCTIQAGMQAFSAKHQTVVAGLRDYVKQKEDELGDKRSADTAAFYRHRDAQVQSSMHAMLQQIYSVRAALDADDDFLQDPRIEAVAGASRTLVALRHALRSGSVAEDCAQFARMFYALTNSPPPSSDFAVLYPQMVYLFAKATLHGSGTKSYFYSSTPPYDEGLAAFASTPPSAEWGLLANAFGVYDVSPRIAQCRVAAVPQKNIAFYTQMHALNKYRDGPTVPPATAAGNRKFVDSNYASASNLDATLNAEADYCSPEGLSLLFQRTGFGLLLSHDAASGKVFFDAPEVQSSADWNHPYGGRVEFDAATLAVKRIDVDGRPAYDATGSDAAWLVEESAEKEVVCRRIIATALNALSWSHHLGVQHFVVADAWLDAFAQNVAQDHPLCALLKPLALGVADSVNTGMLILLNELPTCISSVVSGLAPGDVKALCEAHLDDVPAVANWDRMKARMGPIDTALTRSLGAWWGVISAFVDDYLASCPAASLAESGVAAWLAVVSQTSPTQATAADTVKAMYFNQVLHELSANSQLLYDLVENKVAFTVRKDTVMPSQLIHQRVLETIEGVNGDTPRFVKDSFAPFAATAETKAAMDRFKASVETFAAGYGTDSGTDSGALLPILHPDNIECSIAW